MKLINFINQFIAQPFACGVSRMPAPIAANLSRRKSASVPKTKTIEIKLPRNIYSCDLDAFPTFKDIEQYYEKNNHGYCRKPDAPKILIPFVIEYDEYKPLYIERAIQKTLMDMSEQADATYYRVVDDLDRHKALLQKHTRHLEEGKKWEALQEQVNNALGFRIRLAKWQNIGDDFFKYYDVEKYEKWIQSKHRAIALCEERLKRLKANGEMYQQLLLQL